MQKKILIICFDTPYPTNYGGVYDIAAKFDFYKKNNVKIDLICTCFSLERMQILKNHVSENETVIDNFHVEFIRPNPLDFFSKVPFSVKTRKIPFQKIDFLKKEQYSFVLVEHLKSTNGLEELTAIVGNKTDIYLRIHNDEEEYYRNLYKVSDNLKRYFFLSESMKYKNYQDKMLKSSLFKGFLFISISEMKKLRPQINSDKFCHLLPVYANFEQKRIKNAKTIDFLYVGNLDLDDNFNSLKKIYGFLIQNKLGSFNITIAGKCSDEIRKRKIKEIFSSELKVDLHFNVEKQILEDLYANARYFLNFSSNGSGVKTKLIEAISHGIPVISNREGIGGSGLEHVGLTDNDIDFKWLISTLENSDIWDEYHDSYIGRIQEKIKWIQKCYHQFFEFDKQQST